MNEDGDTAEHQGSGCRQLRGGQARLSWRRRCTKKAPALSWIGGEGGLKSAQGLGLGTEFNARQ